MYEEIKLCLLTIAVLFNMLGVYWLHFQINKTLRLLERFEEHHSHIDYFMSSALATVSDKVNGKEE